MILYCIYFGAWCTCFSVITFPNRNLYAWNLEYKWWTMVCTHARKMGEIAPWVPPQGSKMCFFSVINGTRPLGHLSSTDCDHTVQRHLQGAARSLRVGWLEFNVPFSNGLFEPILQCVPRHCNPSSLDFISYLTIYFMYIYCITFIYLFIHLRLWGQKCQVFHNVVYNNEFKE